MGARPAFVALFVRSSVARFARFKPRRSIGRRHRKPATLRRSLRVLPVPRLGDAPPARADTSRPTQTAPRGCGGSCSSRLAFVPSPAGVAVASRVPLPSLRSGRGTLGAFVGFRLRPRPPSGSWVLSVRRCHPPVPPWGEAGAPDESGARGSEKPSIRLQIKQEILYNNGNRCQSLLENGISHPALTR